jgi:hypothetical protein
MAALPRIVSAYKFGSAKFDADYIDPLLARFVVSYESNVAIFNSSWEPYLIAYVKPLGINAGSFELMTTIPLANLGSGTPTSSKYLNRNMVWTDPSLVEVQTSLELSTWGGF